MDIDIWSGVSATAERYDLQSLGSFQIIAFTFRTFTTVIICDATASSSQIQQVGGPCSWLGLTKGETMTPKTFEGLQNKQNTLNKTFTEINLPALWARLVWRIGSQHGGVINERERQLLDGDRLNIGETGS